MKRRLATALAVAFGLAFVAFVTTVALSAKSEYNSNPPYCRSHGPLEPLWWYFECWLPDPPDWGMGG